MDDLDNNQIPGIPQEVRVFLWDNLSSHSTPLIHNSVARRQAGHRINPRPPYRPWMALIEYVFYQLADRLRQRVFRINKTVDLIHEIHEIIPTLSGFDATFEHCKYPIN